MHKLLPCLLLFSIFLHARVHGAEDPALSLDRVGSTVQDDFETGELNAWESYPIAEDPGFDPEIWCVKEPAFGGSSWSLCKVLKPDDTDWPRDENLVGMTKKIRLWTAASTELRMAAFADGDRKPEELRVVLYGADGKRYVWSRETPPANEWVPLRLTLADFRADGASLRAGTRLDAVTVLARYNAVDPHRSYSLCLDDFRLSGERPRRLLASEPSSTYLDKFFFTFLNRHYVRGETVSLKVRPEDGERPAALKSLTCTVRDSGGKVRAERVPLRPAGGNGLWGGETLYHIAESDPAGQWTLELEGTGTGGEKVRDELRFLVTEKKLTPEAHPRLFFTAADLAAWKGGQMDPKRKGVLDAALASARKTLERADLDQIAEPKEISPDFLDGGPLSPSWDYYAAWSLPGNVMREAAVAGSFLYAFAGDREAGLKAKEAMLRFARFKQWQHPWFLGRHMYTYYPVGLWTYALGIGYDLCYPLFTPEERVMIRTAVMEKAIIPHYRDWVELNRKPSNITNHIGMNTTGMLLAAMAFLGEDPENPDLEPYLSGILAKYKAHIDAAYRPDGSYAEPESYAGTDTQDLAVCLDALERNLGIDWTTTTPVKDAYLYQLYLATSDGLNCPAFGDGGRSWGFSLRNLHLWLAHRTKDPSALERYRWQTESGVFSPAYTFFDFLWYPGPELKPKPITQYPPSRWFRSKGNAVFRSGWEKDALIFALKLGPHSNHYHLDQGTFWLLYNGETLLSEAGVVNYYTNLYYRQFYIQPIAHNTMLLNKYPESQRVADLDDEVKARDEYPRITSCFTTGGTIDAVEGDLSCVYKGKLEKYTRSFVYMKPEYLVMYDDAAARDPERYSWVFNAEGKNVFQGSGSTVRIVRPKAELRMDILSPGELDRTVKPHPDRDGSLVMLTTPERANAGKFLAVLIPSREDNRADRNAWKTSRIEREGWLGAEVQRGDVTDRVLFRTAPGNEILSTGEWETDGGRVAVTCSADGTPRRLWAQNAILLKKAGGETVWKSTSRLSASIDYRGTAGYLVETDAETLSAFSLKVEKKPGTVLLNGAKAKFGYDRKTGMVTLALPAGKNGIAVR